MQLENVIIFGASGHGSVILDCIKKQNKYNVVGFLDSFKAKGLKHCGYPILGSEDDLKDVIKEYKVTTGIIAIGDNWLREQMVDKIKLICSEFNYATVIHPSAIIGDNTTIGPGTVIMPGVIVNTNSTISNHCILNTYSLLEHDCKMGNFSSLAPGVHTGGNIVLGNTSAICIGTTVVEGIRIGDYSVIGAASLVVHNIPNKVLAYGSPARVIRKRKEDDNYLGKGRCPSFIEVEF